MFDDCMLTPSQEFDSPLNLFQRQDSIFRGMCERSGITTAEIEKAALKVHMQ